MVDAGRHWREAHEPALVTDNPRLPLDVSLFIISAFLWTVLESAQVHNGRPKNIQDTDGRNYGDGHLDGYTGRFDGEDIIWWIEEVRKYSGPVLFCNFMDALLAKMALEGYENWATRAEGASKARGDSEREAFLTLLEKP